MFQPTQFMDGANIVIVDNVPYYRYTGVTYLERLKNGLSLDYVFYIQDLLPIEDDESIVKDKSENITQNFDLVDDYEENYRRYEQIEFQTLRLARKGKRLPFKKTQSRNTKKTFTKVNGYLDKLFNIEQNLPNLFVKSQIEIDYDNVSIGESVSSNNDYYDYDYYNNNADYWLHY